ncbi:CASP-like protein 3A1 [Henckelia pumila]|uniref:CASP-like protein 3A1 n=1 Tax=Henckelia pumila TaxID=405737 RepID=UPI003C6DEF79
MTRNNNGSRNGVDVVIELTETRADGGPRNGGQEVAGYRKSDVMHVLIRWLCMLTSMGGMLVMITAKQASTISLYGFDIPVDSQWSFSDSFEYLVGVCGVVAFHSLVQLVGKLRGMLSKPPIIPSRNQAWLIFAADQMFAYAMMSAGSAASGVTNLNRTGIRHSDLPDFCKPLHSFCDHVAVAIALTFLSCFLLAVSVVLDVAWLSEH